MTQLVGTLSSPGTLVIQDVKRHEHHRITITVSSLVTNPVIRIEDVSINLSNPVNLDGSNSSKTLQSEEAYSYLIENEKFDRLQVNFVSGDATLTVHYSGW
jgi:hypothetical protein